MVDIPLPVLLALIGAIYWPVTLGIAVVLALLGTVVSRLWMRLTCFALAAVLAADCLLVLWLPPD